MTYGSRIDDCSGRIRPLAREIVVAVDLISIAPLIMKSVDYTVVDLGDLCPFVSEYQRDKLIK